MSSHERVAPPTAQPTDLSSFFQRGSSVDLSSQQPTTPQRHTIRTILNDAPPQQEARTETPRKEPVFADSGAIDDFMAAFSSYSFGHSVNDKAVRRMQFLVANAVQQPTGIEGLQVRLRVRLQSQLRHGVLRCENNARRDCLGLHCKQNASANGGSHKRTLKQTHTHTHTHTHANAKRTDACTQVVEPVAAVRDALRTQQKRCAIENVHHLRRSTEAQGTKPHMLTSAPCNDANTTRSRLSADNLPAA